MNKVNSVFLILAVLAWNTEAIEVVANCKFNNTDEYSRYGLKTAYECDNRNPKEFAGDEVKIVRAIGTHLSGKSDSDVTSFYMPDGGKLTKIPSNIENVFENIQVLRISLSEITEIEENDIKGMKYLKYLYFQQSKINIIRKDTFRSNPNLVMIHLPWNKIKQIDRHTFDHLNNLNFVTLYGNTCQEPFFGSYGRKEILELNELINTGKCESYEFLHEKVRQQQEQIDILQQVIEDLKNQTN